MERNQGAFDRVTQYGGLDSKVLAMSVYPGDNAPAVAWYFHVVCTAGVRVSARPGIFHFLSPWRFSRAARLNVAIRFYTKLLLSDKYYCCNKPSIIVRCLTSLFLPASLNSMQEFGEAIRKARLSIGKTLQEVAREAGVSTSYVGRVERGSLPTPPSEAAIRAMCTALDIEPSPFLEMRKSFYSSGQSRPLTAGNAVEVALNDIAGLGEQAFRAAEEHSRNGDIDGAMQLAEIALMLLERGRRHASVARVSHLLASLNLDKFHRPGTAIDATSHRIKALEYYEVAVSAFRRCAMPTISDRQKLIDTVAQAARQFEVLSYSTSENYLPISLADIDQWPEIVSLAQEATDRSKLKGDLAKKLADSKSAQPSIETQTDAQILSGIIVSQMCHQYAEALYSIAKKRNMELLEELSGLKFSLDTLIMMAMITINLAGVMIDHVRMSSVRIPEEPFTLMTEMALQLRNHIVTAVSIDRSKLLEQLQRCHQNLGSWRSANEEVGVAIWHLHIAKRLAAEDPLRKTNFLDELIWNLKRGREAAFEKIWDWLERNVSDDEFRTLTYSMEPPKNMPSMSGAQ